VFSEKFYYDALTYMKMNGVLFFEMYFDKTTTHEFELLAGYITQKTDSHYGVSIRSFDGNKHLFAFTDDLSENNLWNIIRGLAKQSTKHSPPKFFNEKFNIDSVKTIDFLYDWNSSQDDVLKVLMDEQDKYNSVNKIKRKSNCFIQEQEIKILSSYNGVICEKRSSCCIKADVESMDRRNSSLLTPLSMDDLLSIIKTKRSENISKDGIDKQRACPTGVFDIILQSGSAALFFHECCGHPLEIQNATNKNSILYNRIGTQISNEFMTFIDNGGLTDLWGSISYDDEGNQAKENILIKDGVLVGYLSDLVHGYRFDMKPTSTTRRQSYKHIPSARMTNTFVAKGNCKENDIIDNTKSGLIIHSFYLGNINPVTGDFRLDIVSGSFISNGIIGEPFYGGVIYANALEILSHVDMVADNVKFTSGFCFASSGRIPVSGGQPTVRIKNVYVCST
jgi:tldD protein